MVICFEVIVQLVVSIGRLATFYVVFVPMEHFKYKYMR